MNGAQCLPTLDALPLSGAYLFRTGLYGLKYSTVYPVINQANAAKTDMNNHLKTVNMEDSLVPQGGE